MSSGAADRWSGPFTLRRGGTMKGQVALVREQGVNFAVVVVRQHTLGNRSKADDMIWSLSPHFDGVPVVLVEQNSKGVPTYYGRPDIVHFLSNLLIEQLPWRDFSLN
jgi:hypothetical protein